MTCYLYPLGRSETGRSQLKYIICGDVYRKGTIDATHFPVFHQTDAFCIVEDGIDVKNDLRDKLTGLIKNLFGDTVKFKILEGTDNKDIHFPFTVDSLEIEVELKLDNGETKLIEMLGAGTVHPDIMKDLGLPNHQAWAFGINIENIAMGIFNIPDIRLFWSTNPKFISQFVNGINSKYVPFIENDNNS
jgi:phenylalanyl-tRNA synthetase alpha chain